MSGGDWRPDSSGPPEGSVGVEELLTAMRRAGRELSDPPDEMALSRMAGVAAFHRREVAPSGKDEIGLRRTRRHVDSSADRDPSRWPWVAAVASVFVLLSVGFSGLISASPTEINVGSPGAGETSAPALGLPSTLGEPSEPAAQAPGRGDQQVDGEFAGRPDEQSQDSGEAISAELVEEADADSSEDGDVADSSATTVVAAAPSTSAAPDIGASMGSTTTAPLSRGTTAPNVNSTSPSTTTGSTSTSTSYDDPEFPEPEPVGEAWMTSQTHTYDVGVGGWVKVTFDDVEASLEAVGANAGWTAVVDAETETEVEVTFLRDGHSTSFRLRISDDHTIRIYLSLSGVGLDGWNSHVYPLGEAGLVAMNLNNLSVERIEGVAREGWFHERTDHTSGMISIDFYDSHGRTGYVHGWAGTSNYQVSISPPPPQ